MANNNIELKFKAFSELFIKIKAEHEEVNKDLSLTNYESALDTVDAEITKLNRQWPADDSIALMSLQKAVVTAQDVASDQKPPTRFILVRIFRGNPEYLRIDLSLQRLLNLLNVDLIQVKQNEIVSLNASISTLNNDVSTLNASISTLNNDVSTLKESIKALQDGSDALKTNLANILAGFLIYTVLPKAEHVLDESYKGGLHKSFLTFMNMANLSAMSVVTELQTLAFNHKKAENLNGNSNGGVHQDQSSAVPVTPAPTPSISRTNDAAMTGYKGHANNSSNLFTAPVSAIATRTATRIPSPNFDDGFNWLRSKRGVTQAQAELVKELCAYGTAESTGADNKQIAVKLIAYLLRFSATKDFDNLLRIRINDDKLTGFQQRVNKLDLSDYQQQITAYSQEETSREDFRTFAKAIYFGFTEGKSSFPKESSDNKQSEWFVPYTKKPATENHVAVNNGPANGRK